MNNKINLNTSSIEISTPERAEELRLYLKQERENSPGEVDSLLCPIYETIDYDEGIMDVLYDALPWEGNRIGILHGGITGTMMDHAAASVIFVYLGHWCPTLDMDVKFLSQMNVGDKLRCKARLIHIGKRFVTASAEMYDETTGKLSATALFTYANGATSINKAKF